jgi:hypothetical protein
MNISGINLFNNGRCVEQKSRPRRDAVRRHGPGPSAPSENLIGHLAGLAKNLRDVSHP